MFSLTLTGVDEWTDLDALVPDVQEGIEFGLLYSRTNTGNRYPRHSTLIHLAHRLPNPALHVCGSRARDDMWGEDSAFAELAAHVQRIQVNGVVSEDELAAFLEIYPDHIIITQHRPENEDLTESQHPRHCILVDGSGGRGILPTNWEAPETTRPIGFAGGLTPDNLREQLERLRHVRGYAWWVDMETGLRTDDRFDVGKALAAIEAFRAWKHWWLQAKSERLHTLHSI